MDVQNGTNLGYSSGNIESAMQGWISEKKLGLKIRSGEITGKELFQILWASLKGECEMYRFLEFSLMQKNQQKELRMSTQKNRKKN